MNALKSKNMMAAYKGFKGDRTLESVMSFIPDVLMERLTGRELGEVMNAVNTAFHSGKAAAGAEVVDDCLWIEERLVPLQAIKNIKIEKETKTVDREPSSFFPQTSSSITKYTYTLDYTEEF